MMPVKWLLRVTLGFSLRLTSKRMVFGIIVVLYLTVGSGSSLIETPNTVPSPANDGGFMDQIGNLEQNIAAVFSKVAYGSTTTKRSIPDSVPIPNLTTVPSPLLTTFRYRERERDNGHDFESDQVINQSAYDLELEKDHALPTSAPNADILKSNSNPTYPNPNRHHNQDRHRLQSLPNSTEYARKGPTLPMFPGDMPSYAPPARSFFTPPLPPEYQNPFADKPTLRGTNSDLGVIHSSGGFHRRPIPPPSLVPGYERIPYRPPDLVPARPDDLSPAVAGAAADPEPKHKKDEQHMYEIVRKKALNTPSIKTQDGQQQQIYVNVSESGPGTNAPSVGNGVLHFPSISRILSGSNGRKEDIPDILLRTVTVRPAAVPKTPTVTSVTHYQGMNLNKNRDEEVEMSTETDEMVSSPKKEPRTTTPFVTDDDTFSTHRIQKLINSDTPSTTLATTQAPPILSADRQSALVTWTIAWNIHVYLSAILYTILAVYSIFKMIFYDKLTHLFSQTYFIAIHMILIGICLGRIFYLCYDAYNMHSSFTGFVSELLLNLPALMLAVTFATLILFLLLRSLNHKANRYSALLRPLTIGVGGGVHICLCITLHYVESYGVRGSGSGNNSSKMYQQDRPVPRVLSLICQIIFIFVCLSLGTFYLYIYRVLKRVLRTKSQNYIHGYQNLSYAIHITIATALLFILMAALQVYGAVSISGKDDLDWLQWGYQFSLRLIEIAIVCLISWVGCLKTGTAKVQREKAVEQHISGFALFPCTSSSSQEHFETDYPAVCNANTNLHTYTLRTGKPIYDDSFAVTPEAKVTTGGGGAVVSAAEDFGQKETESINSQDGAADHYENPNFELQQQSTMTGGRHKDEMFDVCYSEPMHQYDFQNLERPTFERPNSRNEFRASKNLKVLKSDRRQHFNPYSSFERRPAQSTDDVGCHLGVRKSGTLGNIGHYHTQQQTPSSNPLRRQDGGATGRLQGVQTIQRPRYPPARYLQRQQDVSQSHHHHDKSTSANSSDDSVNSGSMLVAEHGFVRFRALDELEAAAAAAAAAAASSGTGKDKRLIQS